MDLLEQDNYYDTTPTTTPSIPFLLENILKILYLTIWTIFFLDEVASSKLNLGLFEAKHSCVIHGLARHSFVCFRSKRVDRCVWIWG